MYISQEIQSDRDFTGLCSKFGNGKLEMGHPLESQNGSGWK